MGSFFYLTGVQFVYGAFSAAVVIAALVYAIRGGRDKRYAPPPPPTSDCEKQREMLDPLEKPGKGG